MIGCRLLLACLLFVCAGAFAQSPGPKPTQEGLLYGKTGDRALKMDYYAGTGVGARPIAIFLHGAGGSKELDVESLASGGYDVFSLTQSPMQQDAMKNVERAVRYVRFHAREWNADARKIALIGVSAGGYLNTMVGLDNASGVMGSDDSVDRESGRVQAVVAIFGAGEAGGSTPDQSLRPMLDPLLREQRQAAELARSSPIYVNRDAPPFLLIDGDTVAQSTDLQEALRKIGMRCDVIRVQNGSSASAPEWEHDLVQWLNRKFTQSAP